MRLRFLRRLVACAFVLGIVSSFIGNMLSLYGIPYIPIRWLFDVAGTVVFISSGIIVVVMTNSLRRIALLLVPLCALYLSVKLVELPGVRQTISAVTGWQDLTITQVVDRPLMDATIGVGVLMLYVLFLSELATSNRLKKSQEELEDQVLERTAHLRSTNSALEREVRQREQAARRLASSEEKYRRLVELSPEGIVIHRAGVIQFVNPTFERMMRSMSHDTLIGRSIDSVVERLSPSASEPPSNSRVQDTVAVEEVRCRRLDGSSFEADVSGCQFELEGEQVTQLVIRDISERKAAERAIAEVEQRLRTVIANVPVILWSADRRGIITLGEGSGLKAFKLGSNQLVGQSMFEVYADYPTVLEGVQRAMAGESVQSTGPLGNRYLDCRTGPMWDDAGNVAGIIGVVIDVTDAWNSQQEHERLEDQMQKSQKLESLGVLAGGIAHDFNNILMGMLGFCELVRLDVPADSVAGDHVGQIETAILRAADLCRQMLAYAGKGKFVVEPFDVNSLVIEMADFLSASVTKGAELIYRYSPEPVLVRGDVTQIRQIILNLITNASDSLVESSGTIVVTTGVVDADACLFADTVVGKNPGPGRFVYFEVSDTGCGMNDATVARIFDPFFSTKETGRGLGLAAVLGIVRSHGGALKVHSRLGEGTSIAVYLPMTSESVAANEQSQVARRVRPGSARILVVDDDPSVRHVARTLLERNGFTVDVAMDGRHALHILKTQTERIAVVLLDLSMPVLDGERTLREIRSTPFDVPVILMSGYNREESLSKMEGYAGFLQKPFRSRDLLAIIEQALGSTCDAASTHAMKEPEH